MIQSLEYLKKSVPIAANRQPEPERPKIMGIAEGAQMAAWGAGGGYTRNSRVLWRYFDGEKTAGGMGPIMQYTVDYEALRMRSWQLMLESEIVQIGLSRSITWGVGKGLKLRCEPEKDILKNEGITIDNQKFSKEVESYWKLFVKSKNSSFSNMQNLHEIVWEAEKNALMGGDCLWVTNIVNGMPRVQLFDGSHVRSPIFAKNTTARDSKNPDTNNRIRHGIEIDSKGEHVAFYVYKGGGINSGVVDYLSYERVPARDKYGNLRAFMYYGIRYRIDDIRGIPLIAVCMETTKQLELYKEATVQGAVERAKIAFTIEHELGAIGLNPFEANMARGFGNPIGTTDIPKDINGQAMADQFAVTTGKQVVNMSPGSKVKNQGLNQDIHFGEFYDTALSIIFAALEIPKEVALMMFGSNYSASRAAIKDWEHTLEVRRESRIQKPYQNTFEVWFLCMILKFKIQAPGYLEAFQTKNMFAMEAYTSAKWIGDRVPDIDALKEAKATRTLLPAGSEHMPLITVEDAIERHSNTEFRNTTTQYADELRFADEQGIEKVELNKEVIEDFDDPKEDQKGKQGEKKNDQKKNNPSQKNK